MVCLKSDGRMRSASFQWCFGWDLDECASFHLNLLLCPLSNFCYICSRKKHAKIPTPTLNTSILLVKESFGGLAGQVNKMDDYWLDQGRCPVYAVWQPYTPNLQFRLWQDHKSFFGAMGCSVAMIFSCLGASYGIAKSGIGISAVSVLRPDMMVRSEFSCQYPSSSQIPKLVTIKYRRS